MKQDSKESAQTRNEGNRTEKKEEIMKTILLTSSSSAKSNTTFEDHRSESRESCYFPGCRKDANCNCEICLASFNATRDLMPMSIQQSSLTKLSVSNSMIERTPISFNRRILSTPRTDSLQNSHSPPLKSTAKSNSLEKLKKKKRYWAFWFNFWRYLIGMSLIFAADSGFSWVVSGIFRPMLSSETARSISEESRVIQDLNGKLGFLQKKLNEVVNGEISNCSSLDSTWKLNKDGLLLNSRCTLYKSAAEELSIWGWPLQTAGLLTTEFSSRSFTILSGRVTEWPEGMLRFSVRKANSSWVHKRWSASAVQLDQNTWVLEYRRSSILENSKLVLAILELLKFRTSRIVQEMKQQFWLWPAFFPQNSDGSNHNFKHPT